MLENLFKNMTFYKSFLNTIKKGGHVFSYLIVSKDLLSAQTVAKLFAKTILCTNVCGKCENCQKINAGAHPDVKVFPEKNDKLLVEESKRIVEESFVKPIFADKKIIIIQNFENSTEEAQNKLLKSLEEPNESVVYILTASSTEKILPTILSRCVKVEVPPISEKSILPMMQNTDDEIKQISIVAGEGYISKTLELSKKENLIDIFNLAFDILKCLNSSRQAVLWSKKVLDLKDDFDLFIEIFSLIIEDLLLLKANKNAKNKFGFARNKLEELAEELSIKCLINLGKLAVKVVKEKHFNVNFSLIVDNFIMDILEVKYLCK